MKEIVFTSAATRVLAKLPRGVQGRIFGKLERYDATGAGKTKALVGQEGVRLRIGDYRVIFVETETTIEVFAVGDRRDIYE